MKLTRRQLAASVALAAAPPLQASPQTEDLNVTARTRLKANADALNPVTLPMATEPAFQFKA